MRFPCHLVVIVTYSIHGIYITLLYFKWVGSETHPSEVILFHLNMGQHHGSSSEWFNCLRHPIFRLNRMVGNISHRIPTIVGSIALFSGKKPTYSTLGWTFQPCQCVGIDAVAMMEAAWNDGRWVQKCGSPQKYGSFNGKHDDKP